MKQITHFFLGGGESPTLSRKEDEDSLHDIYFVEKKSEKKENKLEEGEINSETEMDKISEGNEVRLK